jgi:biotin operon repressor
MEVLNMSKDERPMPNTNEKRFLQDKNCNERIYTYLLLQSKRRPDGSETHRYVEKMSNQQIAEALGLSRNTVGTRMKDLINRGYVIKEGKYYLVPKTDYYTLLPKDTLDFLLYYMGEKEKLIKLYIVLYDYWIKRKTFSIADLHYELGYKLDSKGKPYSRNSNYIRELLLILSGAELVDYTI